MSLGSETDTAPSEIEGLRKNLLGAQQEILHRARVEQVLIAAGLLTREKLEQAHALVRSCKF